MPRTVPSGIAALAGQKNVRAPIWLVKWELSTGTQYLSSGEAVNYGGNAYAANRVLSMPTFQPGLIDRKTRDFSKLEIELDNLASDGSSNFYFTALDASVIFEDAKLTIYAYSPDAADAVLMWWGYSGRPKFSGDQKTLKLSATFFWDSLDLELPNKLSHQAGFNPTEVAGQNKDSLEDEDALIPLCFGVSNVKFRPLIYDFRVEGSLLHVNFVISGCNGQPFSAGDLVAANVKIFGVTEASSIEFLTGSSGQAAPANLTRFPDGGAHPNIAYAYAVFPITNEIKDRVGQITSSDVKLQMTSGRPLLDTTIPSENPVLIIKDLMRDPNFGLGLASGAFDGTAVTDAANYVGTRYQARYELRTKMSATERIQKMLGDCHCFITFDNGLIQIRAKKNTESSSATFATSDSGQSGRKIEDDFVDLEEKDFSELINQLTIKYRRKNRNKRKVTLYDPSAQARAGGVTKKVVSEEYDEWDDGGVWDETETKIIAAIVIREEQNGDLFIEFGSPIWDSLGVAPGDVITVYSPDIFGANNVYRVISQSIESEVIRFRCQVYKSAIYNDDFVSLGVDLLRGGNNTDSQGRPPDVTPTSLAVIDVVTNDTEGKEATLRATWTYPVVDLAAEQAEGVFREYPIAELELWWHYTDESINQARLGATVKYPTATADFHCQFFKSRSVECFFVAIGHNRARSPLGYIPDPTKITSLTANFAANPAITASVVDSTNFAVNDYVQIEKEVLKLASKTSNTLTFVNDGSGNRTPQFDSSVIAHPSGTEVAVAKKSYPSLTLALGRRFTYPVIGSLFAIPTGDGVRFRWPDPDADNRETNLLYWSVDSDALTNAAKLGSATPAWYLADPYTPPSGVFLSENDDHAHKITQSEIGGAGIIVKARVAATNRRNFSSALSSSAQGSSDGSSIPDTATTASPSAPSVNPTASKIKVKASRPTSNFNQFIKNEIVARVKDGGGSILGYVKDDASGPANSATEYKNDSALSLKDSFHWQKAQIVALYPTGATIEFYNYITNGVGTGAASPVEVLTISTWTSDSNTPTPGALTFPASILTNTVDGDPEQNLARIEIVLATANGLGFDVNNIAELGIEIIERNEANTANVSAGTQILRASNSFAGNAIAIGFYLRMGRRFRVLGAITVNGDKQTYTAGSLDFWSGGVRSVDPSETKVVPAPTFQAQPAADGNKIANFTVRVAQDGVDIIWLKHLLIELSYGGGTYRSIEGSPIGLKAIDELYASVSAFKDFIFSCKRKPGVTLDVRATNKAVRGKASATTNATQLAASVGDLPEDSGAAGAVQSLSLVWSTKKGWKATWQRPATNFASIRGYKVVFFDNGGTNFMNPVTGALSSPNTEAGATVFVTEVGYATLLKYANLAAQFTSGVKVKVTPVNVVAGVETDGTSTTSSLVAPTNDDPVATDPASPTAVVPLFIPNGKHLVIECPPPSANLNTWKYSEVVIFGTTSGDAVLGYLKRNSATGVYESDASEQKFNIAQEGFFSLNVKKAQLASLWGGTLAKVKAYQYSTNAFGTSSASATAVINFVDIKDFLAINDAVNVLDKDMFGFNPQQLVNNGDFLYYEDGAHTTRLGGGWRRWDGTTGIAANNTKITTGTSGAHWDQANHKLVWDGNSQKLVYNMERRLIPGDYISISGYIKSGASISPAVSVKLIAADGSDTDDTETVPNPTLSIDSSGYKRVAWVLRLKTTASNTVDHWIVLSTAFSLTGTNDIELDRIMVVRGQQWAAYSPRPFLELNGANAGVTLVGGTAGGMVSKEDPDNAPNSVTQPDTTNPTGTPDGTTGFTQGDYVGSGFGRTF